LSLTQQNYGSENY